MKEITKPENHSFENPWYYFGSFVPTGDRIGTIYKIKGTNYFVTCYVCKRYQGNEIGYRLYSPVTFEGELVGYDRYSITPNGKQRKDPGLYNL